MKKIISCLALILGIVQLLGLSLPLPILFVCLATSLVFTYRSTHPLLPKISIALFVILAISQLGSTRVGEVYNFTPLERDRQINRANQYPPHFSRLASIAEFRLHPLWFEKIKLNFFDSLDFVDLFNNYFQSYYFIFFIFGLIKFIKSPSRLVATLLIISLLLLTIISPKGLYGPFLLFPFIIFLAANI